MKRSFSSTDRILVATGLGTIAATYGLVRLALGLFLPDVQRDLGFGAAVGGAVSSGASVLYCVGALVGFVSAGRSARRLVAAATLAAGLGAVVMAAAPTALVFGAAAVVASTGAGLASPALVQLVRERVAAEGRSRAQAVVNAGTGPGLVVAGLLALLLLPEWRAAWTAAGAVTLLVGAATLLAAGRPSGRPATENPSSGTSAGRWPDRRWVVAHRVPVVAALAFGAGSAVVWTFGRAALVDAGLPVAVTIVAWVAIGLGGAAVTVTARWTSGLTAGRQWAITAVAAAAVLAIGTVPGVAPVVLVACAVFGWGYTAATGALIAWTTEVDAAHAAAGTSMLFVLLVAGQAVGAAVAGSFVGPLGTDATCTAAAVVVLLAAVLPLARRRRPARTA
ncbi:MFS transporter [Curtobacterium citreum]|uniref:MFS transporter n=1 Tax=Curtobacterium citreum TaxID=2036 RepID=A0ABT2HL56_9MICO|nr:MFS transporter [Curtobacterium citreum]MCS6524007.1 MFS transporter [Curtobacterium citreum]TQJ29127.1 putative MFS family arabinose efflux permease [Curtobacterium citreum]GGL90081.1 MFS transporter [Curtobacterium citreum]